MPKRDRPAVSSLQKRTSPLRPAEPISEPLSPAANVVEPLTTEPRLPENANTRLERTSNALAACLFFAVICCNAWYVFVTFRAQFHSDAAMKVLLAEEMARTTSLFPPTWYYINEFPIVFPHFFVLVYRHIFNSYLLQHAAAVYTAVLLFSITVWLLGRQLGLRPAYALLVQAILLSGFSEFFAQVLFGEAAYLMLSTVLLFITYLFVSTYSSEGEHRRARMLRLLALTVLVTLTVAGGSRGILTVSAPVLIGASLFFILETHFLSVRTRQVLKTTSMIAGAVFVGMIAGSAAHLLLIHLCRISYATVPAFATFDQIGQHVIVLVQGWLNGGGALPDPGPATDQVAAVRVVVRLSAIVILTFLPWLLLARYRQLTSTALRFTLLVFAVIFSTTTYFYLFGTIAVHWLAFRYFTAPFVFCVIIAIAFCEEMSRRYGHGFTVVTIPMCILLVGFSCTDLVRPSLVSARSPGGRLTFSVAQNPKQPIVDAARKAGLTFGYATYWNASVVTVLSNADVRVLPVHLVPGTGVVPMRYLGSEWWYRSEAHNGPVFLFVTDDEMRAITRNFLYDFLGTPQRVIVSGGGSLLVYPENFAERIPSWRPQRPLPGPLPPSDRKVLIQTSDSEITTTSDGYGAINIKITNLGKSVLASGDQYPVLIGAHLKNEDGKMLNFDFVQAPLPAEIRPGESRSARVRFLIPSPGHYVVDVDVLQTAVAWFAANGGGGDLPVKVVYPGMPAPSRAVR
jgi:hypothetical protein